MNNTPPPNRQPGRQSGSNRPPNRRPQGGPRQNRGNPNRPPNSQNPQNRNPNPYRNRNGQVPPQNNGYGGYGQPQNNYNGYNSAPPNGYGYNQYTNRPSQPQQQPYGAPYSRQQPDPEYVRRRRELERRQAEARRQAARDRERREKQRRKAERERRFRENMKILGGRLLVFAIILVILCALTGLLFLLFFNHTPDEPDTTGNMTYYYGGSETRKTPIENAVADGVVYICFNDLAEYLGMMESGSAEAMKFILPMSDEIPQTSGGTGTEETITFHVGGVNVEINGQSAQLDIPNIIRGTEVWVSSTFITDYTNNLSLQYNERKSKITISRIVDEANSNEEEEITVYLPVSFKLKNSDAIDPLSEEDVLGVQE